MRTTITLDEALFADLKRQASERGSTISRLIEDLLRLALATRNAAIGEGEAFELVTYGRGGQFPSMNLDKISAVLEAEDLERFGKTG